MRTFPNIALDGIRWSTCLLAAANNCLATSIPSSIGWWEDGRLPHMERSRAVGGYCLQPITGEPWTIGKSMERSIVSRIAEVERASRATFTTTVTFRQIESMLPAV